MPCLALEAEGKEDKFADNCNNSNESTDIEDNPLAFLDVSMDAAAVGRIVVRLAGRQAGSPCFLRLCCSPSSDEHCPSLAGAKVLGFPSGFAFSGVSGVDETSPRAECPLFTISGTQLKRCHDNEAIGEVIKGIGIVREIAELGSKREGKLLEEVDILNCGQLKSDEELELGVHDGTEDNFPHDPEDIDMDWFLTENFEMILGMTERIKLSGNSYFCKGDFKIAARKYWKSLRYINALRDAMGITRSDEEERIRRLEIPIRLNIAAVSSKLGLLAEAAAECSNVLEVEPDNAKALFRRGQTRARQNYFAEALRDLRRLNDVRPKDREVLAAIANVKKRRKEYEQREREFCGKMFQRRK